MINIIKMVYPMCDVLKKNQKNTHNENIYSFFKILLTPLSTVKIHIARDKDRIVNCKKQ